MDFEVAYSPEQEQFRAEVRAWLAEHVPQVEGDRDSDENYEQYRQLGRELGMKGWLRPAAPVEYGGGGLPIDHAIVIAEEVDRYDLRLPPYYDSGGTLGGASILVWGTEEQKRRMLPPIFRGEVVTWQLLTGPEAGSDLAGTTTDARRDGDEYVLNGEKVFVGGSHGADFLWTIARTDATGERHRNLSWFLIPADLPGIQYRRMELLGDGNEGIGSGYKNTIYFDNVRVPASQLVGGENNGWQVASTRLELEHGAGGRIGSNRLFRLTREWARQLRREGRPLIEHADVQERLVDVFVQTEVTRLLNLRNYWMNQSHQRMSYEGPQASYYGKMAGLEVSQAMMDIMGPYALTTDDEWDVSGAQVEPYLKSAIVALHPGGTADIQKVIIARRIGVGRDVAERAGDTGGQAAF